MEAFFIKMHNALHPAHAEDQELLSHIKEGDTVKLKLTRIRNMDFHNKYMLLLRYGYDNWDAPENEVAHKDFDRYRKDVAILAGQYDITLRLDGTSRVEAKSIAVHNMPADDFERLYNSSIEVIANMLKNHSEKDLREIMEHLEGFE